MFIIYDLIFLIFAILSLPVYLLKGKFHRGFLKRLGFLPANLELDSPIWVHAVSVGEAMSVRSLIEGLRRLYPQKKIVISTVTATGNKIAQGLAREGDFVTYLPLDLSFITGYVIGRINPSLFIIAETEIWPNLISTLYRKKIPIFTINGRISDLSFKGYSGIKFLIKPVLNKINLFCMQSERDAQRLAALGVPEEKIKVTGNIKFDVASFNLENMDSVKLRQKLNLGSKDNLFVCGSTHPGEEEIILGVYKDLLPEFPNLKLLFAPRHPQRSTEAAKSIKDFGFEPVKISLLDSGAKLSGDARRVFLLDTVGQLLSFYAISSLVFVGGSLIKKGGHNIIEPASLEKPVLFGPYMFNFRDIAELFLASKAAIQVRNKEGLNENIKELLNNPVQAQCLGMNAKKLVLNNLGSTEKSLSLINQYAKI